MYFFFLNCLKTFFLAQNLCLIEKLIIIIFGGYIFCLCLCLSPNVLVFIVFVCVLKDQ